MKEIKILADAKNITPSQLAIAWTLAKGTVPIPGTKRVKYLEDNIAAADIVFTAEELSHLDSIVPAGITAGDRYDETSMSGVNL